MTSARHRAVIPVAPRYRTIEVWWARPELARPEHLALLDPTELARRARLRSPLDRDRSTVATALLRLVVGRLTGADPTAVRIDRTCDRCGAPHGKPRLPDAAVGVSVSHAGHWVAVAGAHGVEVGVDVEALPGHGDPAALAYDVLAASEADHLETLDHADVPRAVLTYWTRKEAALKATGDGLRVPMSSIAVSPPAQWPRLEAYASRPDVVGRCRMWPLDPGSGHLASLAVLAPINPVTTSPSTYQVQELDGTALLELAQQRWPHRVDALV